MLVAVFPPLPRHKDFTPSLKGLNLRLVVLVYGRSRDLLYHVVFVIKALDNKVVI